MQLLEDTNTHFQFYKENILILYIQSFSFVYSLQLFTMSKHLKAVHKKFFKKSKNDQSKSSVSPNWNRLIEMKGNCQPEVGYASTISSVNFNESTLVGLIFGFSMLNNNGLKTTKSLVTPERATSHILQPTSSGASKIIHKSDAANAHTHRNLSHFYGATKFSIFPQDSFFGFAAKDKTSVTPIS